MKGRSWKVVARNYRDFFLKVEKPLACALVWEKERADRDCENRGKGDNQRQAQGMQVGKD